MAALTIHKVVGALPSTLVPDAIYAVRAGVGFDLYIADATGSVAHKVNSSGGGGGSQQFFVQDEEPVVAVGTPFMWVQTNLPDGGTTVWFDNGV